MMTKRSSDWLELSGVILVELSDWLEQHGLTLLACYWLRQNNVTLAELSEWLRAGWHGRLSQNAADWLIWFELDCSDWLRYSSVMPLDCAC